MGELYNPYPKLPKNIRQIGERDESVKLYMEDYVSTYLKRLYPAAGQALRVGLLLGTLEMTDGTPYIFVDGAMEMENVTDGDKVVFSEIAWKKASQCMEQMFPRRQVLGWFLCGTGNCDLSPLNYWKQHMQYFQGPHKLMFLNCSHEDGESLYITSEDGFYKLRGFCIYYERNQMMQDYMVLRKDVKREESGTDDKVIKDYKKRLESRKEEAVDRHQTVNLLGGLCTAMSIVILAGGIVMFNNYGKMKDMESVIASALPANVESVIMGKDGSPKTKGNSKVVIEEAEGGVDPTTAAVKKETMADGALTQEPRAEAGVKPEDQAGDTQGNKSQKNDGQADGAQGSGQAAVAEPADQAQPEKVQPDNDQQAQSGQTQADAKTQAPKRKLLTKEEIAAKVSTGAYRLHVVQDGETLYGICITEYQDMGRMKELCELNGLEDENKIVSGQELLLP